MSKLPKSSRLKAIFGQSLACLIFVLVFSICVSAQLTGTKNIPGDYIDLAAAIADLNTQGVGVGGVAFNLAVGTPQFAPAGGYVIGGTGSAVLTTASAANPIIFNGNANTITASSAHVVGNLNDAIFKLIGADFVTLSDFMMLENLANGTATPTTSNNMTEFGVALFYVGATDGAQNNTIRGNTIDLNRTYTNTFGIYSNNSHTSTVMTTTANSTSEAGANSGTKIYSNTITDVNQGIVVVGATSSSASDQSDGLDIGGLSPLQGNNINNYGTGTQATVYVNVSSTINGILVRNTKNLNISFNTIASSNGGVSAASTALRGIFLDTFNTIPSGTLTHTINNNNISLRHGFASGIINGINIPSSSANATTIFSVNNNDFNNTDHTTVTASGNITYLTVAADASTLDVNSNKFTNLTNKTTGSVAFISSNTTNPTGGIKNANGNSIITAYNKTGAGGAVTFYTDGGSDPSGATNNTSNNLVTNVTLSGAAGAGSFVGISNANGGLPTKNVIGNIVTSINMGAQTGTFTGITTSFDGGPTTVSGNTVNTVTNAAGITTGMSHGSGGGVRTVTQNIVHTLTGSGTGVVTGILNSGGTGTSTNLTRNKIYGISNINTAGVASGLTVSGGATVNVQNNLVGNITAPNLNAVNSLFGINISAGINVNVDFNTVYLNAISGGVDFGSSAINASTTPTVTMRNNIFVNLSAPNGTGETVAYRRSGTTLTSYGSGSNNNLFYAGIPSATRLIFTDNTNADQTLGAYKIRVSPRDSASVTENPPFLSTTGSSPQFLHIDPSVATRVESGGVMVTGITIDFDGVTRNNPPDIGADEGAFTPLDLIGPAITYTPFGITAGTSNRILSATISDFSGVAGGAFAPRIYFRKNAGSYFSTQCTGSSPNYTCTIDYSLVGGVIANNVIDYFVAAQDSLGNVSANPNASFAATNVNNVTTPPTNPNTYTIVSGLTGTLEVGVGNVCGIGGTDPCPYTSLTNAGGIFAAMNANLLLGNITINVRSNLTGETGTFALNQQLEEGVGAGSYTVLIKPFGAARLIESTTTATQLIKLNGADRVTIDGSLSGGTDRSLMLSITNAAATTTRVVFVGSLGAGAGAVNNTIKNTIVENGSNLSGSTIDNFGIFAGNTSGAIAGPDIDNLTIQNNLVRRVSVGIQVSGDITGAADNLLIADNTVGGTLAADFIGLNAIAIVQSPGASITRNTVRNIFRTASSSIDGIFVGAGTTGSGVTRNSISNLEHAHPTIGFGSTGITIATAAGGSNITVANNFISDIRGEGSTTSSLTDTNVGIRVEGTNTGGINIWNNSVNMFGSYAGFNGATLSAALMINATIPSSLNIRNNILVNTSENSTVATDKNYAIYTNSNNPIFSAINYNDYFFAAGNPLGSIVVGMQTDQADLTAWRGATGQDVTSQSVNPMFASNTDLHIPMGSLMRNAGETIVGVPVDFDGQARPNPGDPFTDTPAVVAYDIGADEFYVPTAAGELLAGRVLTADGRGIRNAVVTIYGGDLPEPRTVRTGSFGWYRFEDLPTGHTYIVEVRAKRFAFSEPSRIINFSQGIEDFDFIADP